MSNPQGITIWKINKATNKFSFYEQITFRMKLNFQARYSKDHQYWSLVIRRPTDMKGLLIKRLVLDSITK